MRCTIGVIESAIRWRPAVPLQSSAARGEPWMPRLCLAVVPPAHTAKLRELDPAEYEWLAAESWDEALALVQTSPVAVGVVDPLLGGEAGIANVERLRELFPSLPLILYTTLTPTMAGVLLRLGQIGVRRVIF